MIVEETKRRKVAVVVKRTVVCNCCGRGWQIEPWEDASWEAQEAEAFKVLGGYGNRRWGDLVELSWHACQDCLADWLVTFRVPPEAAEVHLISRGRTPMPGFLVPAATEPPSS
jgi:hypothetical protein